MSKVRIKSFAPKADIIQVRLEGHEVIISRDKKTKEVYVEVREYATGEEQSLILGEQFLDLEASN